MKGGRVRSVGDHEKTGASPVVPAGNDATCRVRSGAETQTGLQERDELPLGLRIPLDIALRHGEVRMAREFLHVAQAPPNLGDLARRVGDEGAAPGMR